MEALRVQAIADKVEKENGRIPSEFIRSERERAPAQPLTETTIPLIDISLLERNAEARERTVKEIAKACREWGIFVAINHGISSDLIRRLRQVGEEFFNLPQAEKEAYAVPREKNGPLGEGYGTAMTANPHGKLEWLDYFYHLMAPPARTDHRFWPRHNPSYREVTEEYGKKMKEMAERLLEALDEDLQVEKGSLLESFGGENDMVMEMKINYYPKCPMAELALGVEPHSDMGIVTLLVSNGVPGLHVLRSDGVWVSADDDVADEDAVIVHVGDQLERASNGAYRSVVHRSVVSKDRVRMSWPVFCVPPPKAVVAPLSQLGSPPRYAPLCYSEYQYRKVNKLPL
eukprot:TRINITY_DN7256_c0_g1_i1.p1 TRINITY_DN7256_c0_g1~~TRINITY_DN7256_c0_g1_i1.p1  ORF type:complete len:353 (+),score=17.89 TRINITY_DN7256_c0_g1_i1:29-1060(+)